MDLSNSAAEEQFRAECRSWLGANVPRPGLPSGDTRAGFAAHLEWERTLFDARYAVVSWPREYGGREASLWEWLIFEEEYYAARDAERDLPARAHHLRVRHAGAEGRRAAQDGGR
jgi:alkylation response protein AidB-like acyl-CoA dehydrogenase